MSYDYELIYALGSMLGVGESNEMLKLLVAVENLGVDAISAGAILSWACEAYQKNIITQDHTLVPLEWGNSKNFLKALHYIVYQPNDFYQALSQGSEFAAAKYNGTEFLTTFGKLEMAGYHTGPTQALGFLYGTRHSHLDSGPYSYDIKMAGTKNYPTKQGMVDYIINEESWRQILTSLVICLFARKAYDESSVVEALRQMGYDYDDEGLKEIGLKIYAAKNNYKRQCGVNFEELMPSDRIFETSSALGKTDKDFFKSARDEMASRIRENFKKYC